MSDNGFKKYWTDTAKLIATGGRIGRSELYAIYEIMDLSQLNPRLIPGQETVLGSTQQRKSHIFEIALGLWGITPEDWLKKEITWLEKAGNISQRYAFFGKDNINDVVSAEILIRLIAAARIATEEDDRSDLVSEAMIAINLILSDACAKGRTRLIQPDGDLKTPSIYDKLQYNGLMVGVAGGEFLPYPEKSLPELMLMLQKRHILPDAYIKE